MTGEVAVQVTFAVDSVGAQPMPSLPRILPRALGTPLPRNDAYAVPSTPKTAPTPFYPKTPSKSRPGKTPVTVAAFRKRRIQLAASAFHECASNLLPRKILAMTLSGRCSIRKAMIFRPLCTIS